MKKSLTGLLAGTLLATSALAVKLETENQKTSYMIGTDVGTYMAKIGAEFDKDAFFAAINDSKNGKESQLSQENLTKLRQLIQGKMRTSQEAERKIQLAKLEEDKVKNLEEGRVFMAKKAKTKGISKTDSGILYEVLTKGKGAKPPSANSTVVVHYTGTLINGETFDSSVDRGEPATFALNQVIKGWTEGLQLMNTGSKYRFYIPPELAYGSDARPGSPFGPNSTLIFDVELIEIKEAPKAK